MKKTLLPILVLLFASYGLHLKGTGATFQPLPYRNWHVEDGAVMQKALENALCHADGHLASEAEPQITLRAVDFQKRRDIYTTTRAATVNEYLLAMIVKAQTFRNGEPVGRPMEAKIRRIMDYADSEVLGKQEEEGTIRSEMCIDTADQIVRRLTFLKAQ